MSDLEGFPFYLFGAWDPSQTFTTIRVRKRNQTIARLLDLYSDKLNVALSNLVFLSASNLVVTSESLMEPLLDQGSFLIAIDRSVFEAYPLSQDDVVSLIRSCTLLPEQSLNAALRCINSSLGPLSQSGLNSNTLTVDVMEDDGIVELSGLTIDNLVDDFLSAYYDRNNRDCTKIDLEWNRKSLSLFRGKSLKDIVGNHDYGAVLMFTGRKIIPLDPKSDENSTDNNDLYELNHLENRSYVSDSDDDDDIDSDDAFDEDYVTDHTVDDIKNRSYSPWRLNEPADAEFSNDVEGGVEDGNDKSSDADDENINDTDNDVVDNIPYTMYFDNPGPDATTFMACVRYPKDDSYEDVIVRLKMTHKVGKLLLDTYSHQNSFIVFDNNLISPNLIFNDLNLELPSNTLFYVLLCPKVLTIHISTPPFKNCVGSFNISVKRETSLKHLLETFANDSMGCNNLKDVQFLLQSVSNDMSNRVIDPDNSPLKILVANINPSMLDFERLSLHMIIEGRRIVTKREGTPLNTRRVCVILKRDKKVKNYFIESNIPLGHSLFEFVDTCSLDPYQCVFFTSVKSFVLYTDTCEVLFPESFVSNDSVNCTFTIKVQKFNDDLLLQDLQLSHLRMQNSSALRERFLSNKPSTESSDTIKLNVTIIDSRTFNARRSIEFNYKLNDSFRALMVSVNNQEGREMGHFSFLFDGHTLTEDNTPAMMQMIDGDEIDVLQHMFGGAIG